MTKEFYKQLIFILSFESQKKYTITQKKWNQPQSATISKKVKYIRLKFENITCKTKYKKKSPEKNAVQSSSK